MPRWCLLCITFAGGACHGQEGLTERFLNEYKQNGALFMPVEYDGAYEAKLADLGSHKIIKFGLGDIKIFKSISEVDKFKDACEYKFIIDFGSQRIVGFTVESREVTDAIKYAT